jgi:hypothetical protein
MYINYNLLVKCVEIQAKKDLDFAANQFSDRNEFADLELRESNIF